MAITAGEIRSLLDGYTDDTVIPIEVERAGTVIGYADGLSTFAFVPGDDLTITVEF